MSLNYTSPFGERVFAQLLGGNLLTIPNTAGSWNNSGAQYIRVMENSLSMTPDEPKVALNVKHGSASQLARIMGRKAGSWGLNAPIAPSGTQGVAPDFDPVFQSIFGGPGALTTGTPFGNAWQYNIYDRVANPLALFGFQHGQASTGNRFAVGCVPSELSIDFNNNILSSSVQGACVGVVENESFGSLPETVPYGGLTSFPSEPGSFSANGQLINAFNATLTIGGLTFSQQCDAFSVKFATGQALKGDFIDSAYPLAAIFGGRSASVQMSFVNNNSTQLAQLKTWARQNTPVNITLAVGTVSGYRVYVTINGVQAVPATLSDQNGFVAANFGSSASSVSVGASNDIVLGFA